jgi:hypothetical protein
MSHTGGGRHNARNVGVIKYASDEQLPMVQFGTQTCDCFPFISSASSTPHQSPETYVQYSTDNLKLLGLQSGEKMRGRVVGGEPLQVRSPSRNSPHATRITSVASSCHITSPGMYPAPTC